MGASSKSLARAALWLMMACTPACGLKAIIDGIQDTGEKAISAVATPVEKVIVSTTLKNCDVFKTILGVTYDQLNDLKEDNIRSLTVELIKGAEKSIYNISLAAAGLVSDRFFNRSRPLAMFIHGFMASPEAASAVEVTNSLRELGRHNVLALDASSLIKFLYLKSSTCVKFIGEYLGKELVKLVKEGGLNPKDIHLIGHSLGAHISGFAGKTFEEMTGKRIGRISGLDPAGPCFFQKEPELRLEKTDADFVDVIHTDKGVLGIVDPIGHVDFYPNDGDAQPGCVVPPCSHSRAWQLFSESVQSPSAFPAKKCVSWEAFKAGNCRNPEVVNMGYRVDRSARGTYFLKTNGNSPYGMGKEGTAKNSCGLKKLLTSLGCGK